MRQPASAAIPSASVSAPGSAASTRSVRLGVAVPIAIAALDAATRSSLWSLFAAYYEEVTEAAFARDLAEKDGVLVARDATGRVCGFSTFKRYQGHVEGRPYTALFSGDTIMDRDHWGDLSLHRGYFKLWLELKRSAPTVPLYWFLISKGYKTYLLLTRNFPTHYPRWDRPTPPFERALLDQLATRKFGEAYHRDGVIRLPVCPGRLKPGVAPVDEAAAGDRAVQFFVNRNPGHAGGDELCCLGRIDARFVARAGWRTFLYKPLRRLFR
jgi:hypothetical protein